MSETTFTELRRQTLAALVDTFVASVPHEGEDPAGFFATTGSQVGAHLGVEEYLTHKIPAEQLAGLMQLIDAFALTGLKNQPQHVRETSVAVVAGIAPEAAAAIVAVRTLAINFAYAITDDTGRSPLVTGMGFPGVPDIPDRAGRTLTVRETTPGEIVECDAVVIGSGSGGGVAAAELAAAGKQVIVLDAGGYVSEAEFGLTELSCYQQLCLNGGVFATADGMVNIVAGGTVGGGTTLNWSNSIPLPERLRQRWAIEFGLTDVTEESWVEHCEAVMARMKVNDKVAYQNGPHTKLSQAAEAVGFAYGRTNLNIDPERFDEKLSGFSGFGDATGAKQGTMRTFLQDASDNGAELIPRARAVEVLTRDGRATGVTVEILTAEGTVAHTAIVSAPIVVIAAGSMETPALLLRSGIGGPAVGSRLKLHPAGLVSGLYGDEDLAPFEGPAQAGVMKEFADGSEGGSAFLVEGVQQLPGLFASVTPWTSAAEHKELISRYRARADWVFITEDLGGGQISIDQAGRSVATYPFNHPGDQRTYKNGMIACIRMHVAAGADTIFVGGQPFAPWRKGDDIESFITRLDALPIGPGGLVAFSAHQMGSAPLGEDPSDSVADPRGELHDVEGVWIADASGMPTCSSVNPMITTMTLARRTAHNILDLT